MFKENKDIKVDCKRMYNIKVPWLLEMCKKKACNEGCVAEDWRRAMVKKVCVKIKEV